MKKIKVCLDSRLIKKGEYFVPVVGDNFDGHKFIDEVIKSGAAGIIEVDDLYKIALERIDETKPVIVGVAGSVGKSSFRSFLTKILETKYKVLEGDLNTKLGLASLIVNNLIDQKVIVAELGIDRLGEMREVMNFIRPDLSVITKIEKEHLVFLKSIENVTRENACAISMSKNGTGYVNIHDKEKLGKYLEGKNMITFPDSVNRVILGQINKLGMAKHEEDYLVGVYQIVKDKFNFSDEDFIKGLMNIKKPKGRLNIIDGVNGSIIIDDSYNAVSDASVIKGVEFGVNLAKKNGKNLTIILSPMRENGDSEEEQHRTVAEFLSRLEGIRLILVGDERGLYKKYLRINYEEFEASNLVEVSPEESDLFYVKGSQFYRMEKAVLHLMKEPKKADKLLVRQDVRWLS